MGSSGSKIVKKIFRPTSNIKDERQKYNRSSYQTREDGFEVDPVVAKLPPSLGPLVMYRQGSMYFDEDGDLAHEFYVEVKEGRKSKMKRVYDNLRPQVIRVRLFEYFMSNSLPASEFLMTRSDY